MKSPIAGMPRTKPEGIAEWFDSQQTPHAAMTPNMPSSGRVDVIPRKTVMAAVQAQADYEVANFKRSRTLAGASAHYEAAMRAALDEIGLGELIQAAKQGKEFIEYLLTHAPELPDENNTVRRLRAALANIGAAP